MSRVWNLFMVMFLARGAPALTQLDGLCLHGECVLLYSGPINFEDAQRKCAKHDGGHLMTVRSISDDLIADMLLHKYKGNVWMGLHLPSGCIQHEKQMKGFQWVIGGEDSEVEIQLRYSDIDCPQAPLCGISTSDLPRQWTSLPCDAKVDGFLCQFSVKDSCPELSIEQSLNEVVDYKTPYGTESTLRISYEEMPAGSVATLRDSRSKFLCYEQQWIQAPWRCEIEEGGCQYRCAVTPTKEHACYCPTDSTINSLNRVTCEELTEKHPCAPLGCQQICFQSGGTHACACDHGFQLAEDKVTCNDFDECQDERLCQENSACVNVIGSYRCVCARGYEMSLGDGCVDVDECRHAPCEHTCTNTRGSYACSCFKGYRLSESDSERCEQHCDAEECPAVCDPNNPYQCFCPEGFLLEERGVDMVCVDIDECDSFYCEFQCTNTYGGYECSCPLGYTLDDKGGCKELDEEEWVEGSGSVTKVPHASTTLLEPFPVPTRRPSAVSPGGLVGIIVGTTVAVLLLLFGAQFVISRKTRTEGKPVEEEAHGLRSVNSDS